jgi:hypothetical protein
MADLKEDIEDLCRCSLLCTVSRNTPPAVISLSAYNNKPFRYNNSLNFSFVENSCISLKWLGYRSKEENKTPISGVPAAQSRTPIVMTSGLGHALQHQAKS